MAATHYFKTEVNESTGKLYIGGWLWFNTSINQTPVVGAYRSGSQSTKWKSQPPLGTKIYCHIETPTEPAGDGQILTSTFDDSETEYSLTGSGYIKSFTSEAGIFTADQDFSEHEALWRVYYNNKVINVTAGYNAYMQFQFYKRDSSNVDTLLFTAEVPQNSSYLGNGYSTTFSPTGSVATTDRLRIRVYGGERLPS